jgi:hypothetical protein
VGRENYDLRLTLSDGAVITVAGYYMGDGQAGYVLDAIEFFGGERWGIEQVLVHTRPDER